MTQFVSTNSLHRSARSLLRVNMVWKSALMGIAASCGDLNVRKSVSSSGTHAQWASECLYEHVMDMSNGHEPDGVIEFGDALLSIIFGIDSDDRLTVPAIMALEYLVRKGAFLSSNASAYNCGFLLRAAASVRNAWKGRLRDIARMTAAVHALCEIAVALPSPASDPASFHQVAWKPSVEALGVVLGGSVPRLRRIAAEGLYVVLIDQPFKDREALLQPALDLLCKSAWEHLTVVEARQERNKLCELLSVDAPIARPVRHAAGKEQ
jgi:hypothetical protein